MRVIDLFSCIGCHALGFANAGPFDHVALVEKNEFRRSVLAKQFPETPIFEDVRTYEACSADVVFGGPPCQQTSVAAAIHGKRTGASLWPDQLRIGVDANAKWIIVEQPPGNKAWEAEVSNDLSRNGYHTARIEFGACDVGAPYIRRRVYLLACTSLSRLEVAWRSIPSEIEAVARAANARGSWNQGELKSLRVDAGSSAGMDKNRKKRIEALGDSNPPEMAEVIGRSIINV